MAFNVPIASIAPKPTPSDWVRPADWPIITDAPNEVQFLVADTGAKAFSIQTNFTRTSAGTIYIDWGDGTVDTMISLSSTTNHVYSTGGTPCSRGYNTFKIRIYGDAPCTITNVKHISNFTETGGSPYYNIGLLEAYYGDGACSGTAFNQSFYSNNSNVGFSSFGLLEYVKFPSTVTWTSVLSSIFRDCASLRKVIMPTSAVSLTDVSSAFNGCVSLLDIEIPSNATSITTLSAAFIGCENLRTALLPTTLNECTSLLQVFNSCYSLINITIPSINKVTTIQSLFQGCTSLQWAKFDSLPSPASLTTIASNSLFASCVSLQNVYFPTSCSANANYTASLLFSGCENLKNIIFPIGFNANSLSSAFNSCSLITNITFQSPMPSLTILDSAFSGCSLLSSLTLPSTVGANISMTTAFSNCYSLESIIIPSGWTISSMSNTFVNCFNARYIELPNNSQNGITTMSACFSNCPNLEEIVLPTSMTACGSLSSAFSNCSKLISATLPASLNSVTTIAGCFSGCSNLESVTLPTSMTACNALNAIFNACVSIKSITMPSTVSASVTSFSQAFLGCISLETLTLPTTQTSSVTSIASMFTGCGNLTTINNLGKIGSLTATPLVSGTLVSGSGTWANRLTTLSFNCPFSTITLNASSTTQNFNKLNSLRLLNASAGQYTGTSPQINVSYCDLDITALNQLFTDLPTVVGKTINITSCTGAAGCTRTIATLKGWTVTG